MKYLCMAYFDEKRLTTLSEQEAAILRTESIAYNDRLREQDHYCLQCPGARELRQDHSHGERPSITDGPFAETKEQLGGFILIEALDLNHATKIASKIPVGAAGLHQSQARQGHRRLTFNDIG